MDDWQSLEVKRQHEAIRRRAAERRIAEAREARQQAQLFADLVEAGTIKPGSKAYRLFAASVERRLARLEGKPVELEQERKLCAGGLRVVGGKHGR